MLKFYYDCLVKYLKANSFELTETDTDNMYVALHTSCLDEYIRDDYVTKFRDEIYRRCSDNQRALWFPRRCCHKHISINRSFTGLMKGEFSLF